MGSRSRHLARLPGRWYCANGGQLRNGPYSCEGNGGYRIACPEHAVERAHRHHRNSGLERLLDCRRRGPVWQRRSVTLPACPNVEAWAQMASLSPSRSPVGPVQQPGARRHCRNLPCQWRPDRRQLHDDGRHLRGQLDQRATDDPRPSATVRRSKRMDASRFSRRPSVRSSLPTPTAMASGNRASRSTISASRLKTITRMEPSTRSSTTSITTTTANGTDPVARSWVSPARHVSELDLHHEHACDWSFPSAHHVHPALRLSCAPSCGLQRNVGGLTSTPVPRLRSVQHTSGYGNPVVGKPYPC